MGDLALYGVMDWSSLTATTCPYTDIAWILLESGPWTMQQICDSDHPVVPALALLV